MYGGVEIPEMASLRHCPELSRGEQSRCRGDISWRRLLDKCLFPEPLSHAARDTVQAFDPLLRLHFTSLRGRLHCTLSEIRQTRKINLTTGHVCDSWNYLQIKRRRSELKHFLADVSEAVKVQYHPDTKDLKISDHGHLKCLWRSGLRD